MCRKKETRSDASKLLLRINEKSENVRTNAILEVNKLTSTIWIRFKFDIPTQSIIAFWRCGSETIMKSHAPLYNNIIIIFYFTAFQLTTDINNESDQNKMHSSNPVK